jgi:hypothetical protein
MNKSLLSPIYWLAVKWLQYHAACLYEADRQNSVEVLCVADLRHWLLFSLGRLYCKALAVAKEAAILLLSLTELGDLEADPGLSREPLHPYSLLKKFRVRQSML